MKFLQYIALLSGIVYLNASERDVYNYRYTLYERFIESIEDGDNRVLEYCQHRPQFLTKIDRISGYSTLEIAAMAENEAAVRTILSLSFSQGIQQPIAMALRKAQQLDNLEIAGILQDSLVKQDNR